MKKANKKIGKRSKFQDWVYKTVSCCNGCSNDCIYCFAKGDAINKKRISLQNWKNEVIRQKDVNKEYKLFNEGNETKLTVEYFPFDDTKIQNSV